MSKPIQLVKIALLTIILAEEVRKAIKKVSSSGNIKIDSSKVMDLSSEFLEDDFNF